MNGESLGTNVNPVDGTMTVSYAGRVTTYDVATGRELASFEGQSAYRSRNGETIIGIVNSGSSDVTTVILAADGVRRTVIGQHGSQSRRPILSPDGSLIAMQFTQDLTDPSNASFYNGLFHIGTLVYRRDSEPQLHLSRGDLRGHIAFFIGCEPEDWTPDGRLVVTCDVPAEERAYLTESREKWLGISDRQVQNLFLIDRTMSGSSPSISPDGRQVAFVHRDNVWVANLDGSEPRQVTDGDYGQRPRGPVWSPDGKWLAVQGEDGAPNGVGAWFPLYVVSATASNEKLQTKLLDGEAVPIRTGSRSPSWR